MSQPNEIPSGLKQCNFCCYLDCESSSGELKLYPKEDYIFYAGFLKQLDVDKFDEYETENINFCPICGRKLRDDE